MSDYISKVVDWFRETVN